MGKRLDQTDTSKRENPNGCKKNQGKGLRLVIKEVEIKTTMPYHYASTEELKSKWKTISSANKNMEQLKFFYVAEGKVN